MSEERNWKKTNRIFGLWSVSRFCFRLFQTWGRARRKIFSRKSEKWENPSEKPITHERVENYANNFSAVGVSGPRVLFEFCTAPLFPFQAEKILGKRSPQKLRLNPNVHREIDLSVSVEARETQQRLRFPSSPKNGQKRSRRVIREAFHKIELIEREQHVTLGAFIPEI